MNLNGVELQVLRGQKNNDVNPLKDTRRFGGARLLIFRDEE
jgi:hypothetical protein